MSVRYVSTRGAAPELDFEGALFAGLAADGGLYVPQAWPTLDDGWRELRGAPYERVAEAVLRPFVGEALERDALAGMLDRAYAEFAHSARAPLVQLRANDWLLELFHGPTLAFKDFAMQVLGLLFEHFLERRGRTITVLGATSGDTGAAAVAAFAGKERVRVIILHPAGRVSKVQRRQMTTCPAANVFNVAVEGTFDDCQALVKAAFNDARLREELGLAAVNSINWGRIMVQAAYYAAAIIALGGGPVRFAVPSGNFGDVFAGYVAQRMGLPVAGLVVATNVNDILARFLKSGEYRAGAVVPTISPSMDIQVASNFERLLFELCGRDGARVAALMDGFKAKGALALDDEAMAPARAAFAGCRVDEGETRACIAETWCDTGMLVCPHTAVGLAAGRRLRGDPAVPLVHLATAHPAKFPDAIWQACGERPSLPLHLADLLERDERCAVLPNDGAALAEHLRSL